MKTWRIIGLMMIALSTLQACKDDDDEMNSQDETAFVAEASSANTFEIQSGQLAQTKGQSTAVKTYGSHMVTDHTMAATEMNSVAMQSGISVSATMNANHQAMYNQLNALSGVAFDKAYAQMMVTSHQSTLALFTTASTQLDLTAIKNFAASKIPTLTAHLQEAVALNTTVNQ